MPTPKSTANWSRVLFPREPEKQEAGNRAEIEDMAGEIVFLANGAREKSHGAGDNDTEGHGTPLVGWGGHRDNRSVSAVSTIPAVLAVSAIPAVLAVLAIHAVQAVQAVLAISGLRSTS